MQFESLQAFIEMGTHGPYVWAAFGAWFLVVGGLVVQSRLGRKKCYRDIQRYLEETE